MSNAAKTSATTAAAKATAATPKVATAAGASAQAPTPTATTTATLYVVGVLPPVRQHSIRHYAQATAKALQATHPAGFTLAQFRAALVAGIAGDGYVQPRGGWAAHNMPTWCALPAQAWLVAAPTASK